MRYIVENAGSGERQVVNTEGDPLDGLGEGWAVVASDVPEPPDEGEWDGSQWVVNTERLAQKQADGDELNEVTDRERLRRALRRLNNRQQALIDAVQALQARVTALEGN
jgi:hypothetical protein